MDVELTGEAKGREHRCPRPVLCCRSDPHALEGAQGLADLVDFLFTSLLIPDRLLEQGREFGQTSDGFAEGGLARSRSRSFR